MARISIISTLFLAILASSGAINCQLDTFTFILSEKSFSIRSRIISSRGDTFYRLNELYSIDQRRGKVILAPDQNSAKYLNFDIEYTYDAMIGAGIEHDKLMGTCKPFSLDNLMKGTSFGEIMKLAGADRDLSHVIGPARLLFLIASRANEMRLITKPGSGSKKYLRNIPTVMFELDLNSSGSGSFSKMYILYNELAYYPNSPRTSIPLQIILDDATNDNVLFIDYYQLEILSSANKVHSLYRSDAKLALRNSADSTVDMFAFPISLNCGKHLGEIKQVDLLRQHELATTRFSFTSDDANLFDWSSKHFVAFDGPTYSMRIDNLRQSAPYSKPESTMTLLDFQTNRKYITQDNFWHDQHRRLRAALGTIGTQCVVTNILSLDDEEDTPDVKMADLLLGASKFTYMGRAQVNGLVARVYEASSITWPFWLSRPMLVRNRKGSSGRRELHTPLRQTDSPQPIKTDEIYSIVVYILDQSPEEDTSEGAKLLQLEIYDLAMTGTSSHRMIGRVRFHDFIWDLKEAPNGDEAHQLFSHIELCSAGRDADHGGNKYAEVDLLLEEDEKQEGQEKEAGDVRDIDWIENWMLRDEALASSFRDVLKVQSTMMYDLKSRLIKHNNIEMKRFIEVSFRVAEHPLWLHQVTFVGNGRLENLDSSFTITGAQSPIECLWLADNSIRSIYIYYSESTSSCVIDLKLVKAGAKMNLEKSDLFKLDTRETGEIYLVERRFDDKIKLANTWLRNEQNAKVMNSLMRLQHIRANDLANPVDRNEFLVRLRAMKIKNVNFMQGILGENERQVQPPAASFPGFNLVIPQESTLVRRPGRVEEGKSSADGPMRTMFTREQCQTECLANVACQAYSYCVRGTEGDCLLSDLGFTGPGISEQLKSREVQQLKQGSSVQVKIGQQDVQLVRDFRCELYNKVHMDFFKRKWPSTTSLRGPKVSQVKNEEQCAKLCFDQSLKSILSTAALANEIENSLSSIEDAKSIANDRLEDLRRKHRQEMTQFCQSFVYVDSSISEQQERLLKRRAKATSGPIEDQESGVSYCLMDDVLAANSSNEGNELGISYFEFATFRFDFVKLFEKKYHFGLRGSEFSREEHDAYLALHRGETLESKRYELLKNMLADGKNRQLELHTDENICAQQCFMQISGIWPACRSFDMRHASRSSAAAAAAKMTESTCVLNTESYNSERSIDDANEIIKSDDTQLWHYEPRFKLVQQEVDNAHLLDGLFAAAGGATKGGRSAHLIGSLGVFLVVLVGVVSGLASGLLLTRRFIQFSSTQRNQTGSMSIPFQIYDGQD